MAAHPICTPGPEDESIKHLFLLGCLSSSNLLCVGTCCSMCSVVPCFAMIL